MKKSRSMCRISFFSLFFIIIFVFFIGGDFFVLKDHKSLHNDIGENQEINKSSVISYIINLEKSKDRLDYIRPSVIPLGYGHERIDAVYGKNIPEDERQKLVEYSKYRKLMKYDVDPGTIGCFMSHVKTWETFLRSSYEYAIIFEDDVLFDPDELRKVVDSLIKYNETWDIVSFELLHSGSPMNIMKIDNTKYNLVKYRARVSHTGCYIINRNAARKLLEKAFPIVMPVDHYFIRSWEIGTKFRGVEPRIVHQKFGDSEIMNQMDIKDNKRPYRLIDKITGLIFEIKTGISIFINSYIE